LEYRRLDEGRLQQQYLIGTQLIEFTTQNCRQKICKWFDLINAATYLKQKKIKNKEERCSRVPRLSDTRYSAK